MTTMTAARVEDGAAGETDRDRTVVEPMDGPMVETSSCSEPIGDDGGEGPPGPHHRVGLTAAPGWV
jgi:hypothetical protein